MSYILISLIIYSLNCVSPKEAAIQRLIYNNPMVVICKKPSFRLAPAFKLPIARYRRITPRPARHRALDFAAPKGTPVYAAKSGTVRFAGYNKGGYGNLIIIDHAEGYSTYYAHLSKILVSEGDHVKAGEKIGLVGSTGRSTGPHLHFEIRLWGKRLSQQEVKKKLGIK